VLIHTKRKLNADFYHGRQETYAALKELLEYYRIFMCIFDILFFAGGTVGGGGEGGWPGL
jgi:hypothetical protein